MSNKKGKSGREEDNMLVVGLGASAGGLEALRAFFSSLPDQTGMAFIVVLHLAPEKKSSLAEILQNETALEVRQVSERTSIKPDHVYIIPPDKMLSVENNHLVLSMLKKKNGLDTINLLLRTLAEKKGKYAAGIILSGSGSDGIAGLKAIKEHEGFALVQNPDEAKNPGMPHNAIKTGVMDKVLRVEEMADELVRYSQTFFKIALPERAEDIDDAEIEDVLHEIFEKVRLHLGHDFGNYRRSSVLRRISRRMRLVHVHSLEEYLNYLNENTDEIDELFKDLLISVTDFFRDKDAFKALEEKVIPRLFEDKGHDEQIRVWVPGCATGEEAYSIAMLLREYSIKKNKYPEIQIFASDVDEEALKTARQGRYPKSIEENLTDERLHRFFIEKGDEYIIKEELKEVVLFASHDLLRNAPFSRQDLIACRNLLIYLNRDMQKEVFNLLCYSFRPSGWLFLGRSDSHIGTKGMFKTIDRKHHIYQQKPSSGSHAPLPDLPLLYKSSRAYTAGETPTQRRQNIEKMHWRILTRLFAPQSALIDEDYNVVHATEGINQYLEYGGGEPSRNILDMVKTNLRQSLRSILFKLGEKESLPAQPKVQVRLEEADKILEITVCKLGDSDFQESFIHVVFEEIQEIKPAFAGRDKISDGDITGKEAEIVDSLEKELDHTKEQLRISIEQYETSNEELRTSNEELQSMNEELQSTTEELETSKEELQSVNEELKILNEELEGKVEELSRANNDLQNLMETTELGILFVDLDGKIRRFTQALTDIFNLIPSDEGRPLDHITHSLDYDNLLDDIRQVKNHVENIKKVVSTTDDRHYIMRLRPYRSTENKVEGVVLTFSEITDLKASQEKLEAKARQEEALAQLGLYALAGKKLDEVVHRGIQMICEILDVDYSLLHEFNQEANTFQLRKAVGAGFEGNCPEDIKVNNDSRWDISFAFEEKKIAMVDDYSKEQRFGLLPALEDFTITSGVNIIVEGTEQAYGVLSVYSIGRRAFSEHDISFLQVIANLVGEAIDRRRASNKLEETNKLLREEIKKSRQYQRDILNNSIIQRWEIGSHLHDNLAQMLISAKIIVNDISRKFSAEQVDVLNEIEQLTRVCDKVLTGIRDLTHDIIPVDIEQEGVAHAFHFLMRQTQKIHDVNCILKTDEVIEKIKDRKLATHLYHIVQEAVKNAAVHGQAKNITVSIQESDDNVVLQVKDDGTGLSNTTDDKNGRGIRIMKHRMELMGGNFDIEDVADPGRNGTLIICTIPLEHLGKNDS